MISFVIPGEPVPWARTATHQGRLITPAHVRAAKEHVALIAKHRLHQWGGMERTGAYGVTITCFVTRPKTVKRTWPSVKPDVDNYAKLILDALNGIAWVDDGEVVRLTVSKMYAREGNAFTQVDIESIAT